MSQRPPCYTKPVGVAHRSCILAGHAIKDSALAGMTFSQRRGRTMMMHRGHWRGSVHRREWTPGAVLVSLGLLFLGLQLLSVTGALPLLALAAIFIFFSHTGDRR